MNINGYIKRFGNITMKKMPFNEVDALILSELAYVNLELLIKDNEKGIVLKKIPINKLNNKAIYEGSVDASFNKTMLKRMVNSKRFSTILIKHVRCVFSERKVAQFYAFTIFLPTNEYFISFRGTDTTLIGWKEDFGLIYNKGIYSHTEALKYAKAIISYYPDKSFYLGGHSKGGNLSSYVALNLEDYKLDKLIAAYSFDGPGFKDGVKVFRSYKLGLPKIKKYLTHRDSIGLIYNEVEDYKIVYSNGLLLGGHDPFFWQVDKEGKFIERTSFTASAMRSNKRFNDWLSSLSINERRFFIDTIFVVFNGSETIYDLLKKFLFNIAQATKSLDDKNYSDEDKNHFFDIITRLVKFLLGVDDLEKYKLRKNKVK